MTNEQGSYLLVDGEDGPDGDETVDVGGPVQGVEAHDVFTLRERERKKREVCETSSEF